MASETKQTETPAEYMARLRARCTSHTPIGLVIVSLQAAAAAESN